jgi:uncharacterized protein (DUF983 family)
MLLEPMMSGTDKSATPSSPPSPYVTGLIGRCPRCGRGKLFSGLLQLAPNCSACGLDYAFVDTGDGPSVFVTLFAGFLVLGAALVTEIVYEPPIWVHLVIFLPLVVIVCIGLLRPTKGILIALQYRNKAEPGRLEDS